ncbi:DUF4235 domain-containing protein [Ornithinimicrobium faecis]|uniref:DUF4235 domain-containing protein n=1 Tax=Ornithinimicrobium faecis TaxID=2934158 RepID=A0ABY4YSU5_9MICO|nr:DUF4235 domain-containing protein [Ornithinimicrobium sp. HY1793]USQ79793.1 DUF4235 domain-containing protein [Ornithinimicrobium sp. HY1793]
MGNLMWKVMAAGAAVGASIVARKLTDGTWKFVSGGDSPSNPEDPDIDIKEAIAFAVLSGAIVGLSRLVANRQATKIYEKSTGHLPQALVDARDAANDANAKKAKK